MINDMLEKVRNFFSEPDDEEGAVTFSKRAKDSKDKFLELVKRLDPGYL